MNVLYVVSIKDKQPNLILIGQPQQPQKCGGAKPYKGCKPDCGFAEPEPSKGAKRIPYAMRSGGVHHMR